MLSLDVLLKFDYFAFLGLTMQLLILVLADQTAQYAITIAAIPVVLILLTACGIAVAREIRWLMICSLILLLAAQAYFVYKFTRLFVPQTRHRYDSVRKTVGVFIAGAFLLVFATFCIGMKCMLDFSHGLKPSKMNEPSVFTLARFRRGEARFAGEIPMSPNEARRGGEHRNHFSRGELPQYRVSIE